MKFSEAYSKTAGLLAQTGMIAGDRSRNVVENGTTVTKHCVVGGFVRVLNGKDYGEHSFIEKLTKDLVARASLTFAPDKYNGYQPPIGTRAHSVFTVAAWSNNLVDAGKAHEVIQTLSDAAVSAAAEGL